MSEDGNPHEGYDLDLADAVTGNGLDKKASWNGIGDVGDLAGRPTRLRFTMRSMKLYAFQFVQE